MSKSEAPSFSYKFLLPRYWPTLAMVLVMYLLSWLPYFIQFRLGQWIGLGVMRFMPKRRQTIEKNLSLCFPDMTEKERNRLVEMNIRNAGLALFETGMAWFWPDLRVRRHVTLEGMEHIYKLESEGKGMLMMAVHSMNLELGARAFGITKAGMGVYRPNSNPCFDYFQYQGRSRSNRTLIDRRDVKGMIHALRTGKVVWYAPDHDYGRRRSTFAPLFAVENACTTTGTSLLADASECAIVPFTIVRNTDSGQYTLKMHEPLEAFPHKDEQAAAVYINKAVERSIMEAPEQYMWLHRRFKTRPEGEACLYAKPSSS